MCTACLRVRDLAVIRHASGYVALNPYRDLGPVLLNAALLAGATAKTTPTLQLGLAVITRSGIERMFPAGTPMEDVESAASMTAARKGNAEIVRGACRIGATAVWERLAVAEPMDDVLAVINAAEGAEALLSTLTGERIEKALNPLTPIGFLAVVRRFREELRKTTAPIDASLLDAIMNEVGGTGWFASEATREAMFRAIKEAVPTKAIEAETLPALLDTFSLNARDIMATTRERTVADMSLDIETTLSLSDEKAVKSIASTNYNFVRDSFGMRSEQMSAKARSVVAAGMDAGLDGTTIAGQLESVLPATYAVQQKGYLDVVSMAFTGRARSRSRLSAYDDAGATGFKIMAVKDGVTSDICLALDGHIIPVKETLALNERAEAEADKDPESIKTTMPWLQMRQTEDGPQIVVPHGNGHKVVASGKDGNWTVTVHGKQFTALGIGMAPYHGRCRTTDIPIFD